MEDVPRGGWGARGSSKHEPLPRKPSEVRQELQPNMLPGPHGSKHDTGPSSRENRRGAINLQPRAAFVGIDSVACAIRILLVALASSALLAAERTVSLTTHGVGAVVVIVSGATVAAARRGQRTEWLHRSAIALEVVLLAEWIRVFSGITVEITEGWSVVLRAQPLFTLAYIPVLVSALLDGPRGSMATSLLAIIAYIVRVGQSATGMRAVMLSAFGPQFVPLLLVALAMGYLARAAQRERAERDRRDADLAEFSQTLRLAAEMHESVRPHVEASIPGADLVVREISSERGLGSGDFCAVLPGEDHVYWFCVADVAGRTLAGLASMPLAYAAFWTSVRHHERPEDSVREISELLDRSTRHDVFVALFLARYDARTGEFRYCNAGQPHGLLVSGGDVVRLTEGGPPAGAIPATMGPEYRGGSLALEPGATVLIGTDGVLGDEDVAGRVEKLLLEQGGSLEGLARSVLAEAGAEDDRGIIMLRRHGGGRLSGEGSAGDGEALEGHGSATNRPVS